MWMECFFPSNSTEYNNEVELKFENLAAKMLYF